MGASYPISITELPEPMEMFPIKSGQTAVIYNPSIFYRDTARMNLAHVFVYHRHPMIIDEITNHCYMHIATANFIEGQFSILILIGNGLCFPFGASDIVSMNLRNDFKDDYVFAETASFNDDYHH